ncbi:MAG: MBL fold metallo-hydrolase [Candidatus Omnitrophica bacterium]|nr:MBL fold metallo-hydrolase [Candidatus Omnitrophota bacterium]
MLKFIREKKSRIILFILILGISFIALRAGLPRLIPELNHSAEIQSTVNKYSENHQITREDNLFLQELRSYIAETKVPDDEKLIRAFSRTTFQKNSYGVVLTAYQSGLSIIRGISTKRTPEVNILKTATALRTHAKASSFNWNDPKSCRIQIDFIAEPLEPIDIKGLCEQCLSTKRFEPGVDGLVTEYKNKKKYFLPGDAFRLSIYSLKQTIENNLHYWKGVPKEMISWSRLHTQSFISYNDVWLELYRGQPIINNIDKQDLLQAITRASEHTIKNQKPDGSFLYYYDSARNSFRDHEHPENTESNRYYNDLRHCGGVIMLLHEYQRTKNINLLEPIRKGIRFIIGLIKEYPLPSGEKAGYVYYNTKAKLGGNGIALYLLAEYQRIPGDDTFVPSARLLHRHLLTQILPSGEFMYYTIYLNKKVSVEDNQKLFNFYYPGEAIIGLVQYIKYTSQDPDEKKATLEKIKAALHFLLEDRPKSYALAYASLPSDSWLMMAINELWDIPEARNESYPAFVFSDTDKMLALTYTAKNALYPDYPGSFSYQYGDLPYADGARAEGFLAATYLAQKTGNTERFNTYSAASKLMALALMRLVNTPEAMYFADNKDLAIGGVRFKHTRQWFRIDTTAHVILFFLKLLPLIDSPGEIVKTSAIGSLPAKTTPPPSITPPSSIYALQYATSEKSTKNSSLGWFTFLIQNGKTNILIDTALKYPLPKPRWGITETKHLPSLLKPLGITPETVNIIIITHAHDDHADQLDSFPNATIYIHQNAYAALSKSPKHQSFLKKHAGQIKTFTTVTNFPMGLTIYPTSSHHAPGISIVSFKTQQMNYIFPSDLCHTATDCCDKIKGISDDINTLCNAQNKTILPHHDHYEKTNYPMTEPGIYKIK